MDLEIANRLLELRRSRGYSQEELAARLGVSLSPSGSGRSPPRIRITSLRWPGCMISR